ncbi:MAG: hypothetical protein ACYC4S_12345 [Rhodoferax sp.]
MKTSHIAFATIMSLFTCAASAQPISAESKFLAQCEFSYFYVGQLMQLRNNEGGAKALLRRSSMMTTANFILNEEKGVVAGWKIREFTLLRDPLKLGFDAGIRDPLAVVADCDRNATPIAIRIRDAGKTLWGKDFDELQLQFFEKSRKSLGL